MPALGAGQEFQISLQAVVTKGDLRQWKAKYWCYATRGGVGGISGKAGVTFCTDQAGGFKRSSMFAAGETPQDR